MTGGKAALWKDEDMADVFTRRAVSVHRAATREAVLPVLRAARSARPARAASALRRRDGMGPRGDAIAQLDWSVGEMLATLDRLKLASNTLVLFTSDNGPVLDDGYRDEAVEKLGDHTPAGPFRGGKYSNFEGGTRVPFIVRWPARVKPGVSDALVSQVDLLASFAALVGSPLNDPRARDSENVLPALLGTSPTGAHGAGRAGRLLVAAPGTVEIHRAGQGTENQREHEHRARERCRAATLRPCRRPWRTHQSRRETTGEGARARRPAERNKASWRTARSLLTAGMNAAAAVSTKSERQNNLNVRDVIAGRVGCPIGYHPSRSW